MSSGSRVLDQRGGSMEEPATRPWNQPAGYPGSEAKDIVRYDTATGARTVLVSASRLVPAADTAPIRIDDYAWSKDNSHILVFTNSQKVWRQNTRGDYWVLDLASGKLQKLGGEAPAASLMFAQFSPDGHSVAYVHANNLYVQDLGSGAIRPLTSDGCGGIDQRDFRLGQRGGTRYSKRFSLESGRPVGRLLAIQYQRCRCLHAHQ